MKYKFIIFFLFLFLLCGCNKISDVMPKGAYINVKREVLVFSDVYIKDLISDTNVEIIDKKINTNVIGEKELEIYYTYKKKKYVYKTSIEIIDNESPKIFGGSNKTVTVGYTGDLCNLVMYGDNYDGEPLCEIEGDYDLEKEGIYKIKIVVKDNSGNSSNHNITLNVVEKVNNKNNTNNNNVSKKLSFSEAIDKYKTEDTELGIDVSEWQGKVDYKKVKNAGASFVMMRIGVKLKTGEEPVMDGEYLRNIKEAKNAGLKVGVYLYSKARSREEAIEEAKWVIEMLDGESLDLPIVFDWEIWSGWNSYHLSFHELNEMPKAFIKVVEDAGYEGMLYGSKFYLESFWDGTYENVWLAHYASSTSYKGDFLMWQFSNIGRIDGIYGDVDLNILYLK